MEVSVIGRVNNITLPLTKALFPVFEAIINSIQACHTNEENNIDLFVNRDLSQPSLSDEADFLPDIQEFIIKDNGCGFNTENFSSFARSASTSKIKIGGKGIGRFLWLKAFECVIINSIFIEDSKKKSVRFKFSAEEDTGISELKENAAIESVPVSTEVKLVNILEKYRRNIPKETRTIAQKLFEYCLPYYINGHKLNINVSDNYNKTEVFSLLKMYHEFIKNDITKKELVVKSKTFDIHIIKHSTTSETSHRIVYCAHSREVRVEKLNKFIPLLSHRLKDNEECEYILIIYIVGKYLDEMANQERTHFLFEEETGDNIDGQNEFSIDDPLTLNQIRQSIIPIIESHIADEIKILRENHMRKITDMINETSPEYRSVLKYCPNEIYNISPALSVENIEIELHKLRHHLEINTKQRNMKLLEKEPSTDKEIKEFIDEHARIAEELTNLGKDKLTDYVIQRHAIIKLFESRLKKRDDGKYPLEEALHNIIVPLKTTSDEVDYTNQNLWLIDERFTYHNYLASDRNMKKKGKTKRADVLIFNKALTFTEDTIPYQSIVIIEFKRPQRDNYTDEDNPVTQIIEYMELISSNKAKDSNGRPIAVGISTRFYIYIVCDITPKIERIAKGFNATKSPDEMGYFFFNNNYNAYIEITSFDKILSDSKKRNRILFEKLGLPDKL